MKGKKVTRTVILFVFLHASFVSFCQQINHNSGGLATTDITFSVGEIYVVDEIKLKDLPSSESPQVALKAHPNPIDDHINITRSDSKPIDWVTIHDISGRLLVTRQLENSKLIIADFPSGIYLISSPTNEFETFKIIKK